MGDLPREHGKGGLRFRGCLKEERKGRIWSIRVLYIGDRKKEINLPPHTTVTRANANAIT